MIDQNEQQIEQTELVLLKVKPKRVPLALEFGENFHFNLSDGFKLGNRKNAVFVPRHFK